MDQKEAEWESRGIGGRGREMYAMSKERPEELTEEERKRRGKGRLRGGGCGGKGVGGKRYRCIEV